MSRQPLPQNVLFHRNAAWKTSLFVAVTIACPLTPGVFATELVDGFVEPYKSISVATPEIGVISELMVEEGSVVRRGEALAKLDTSILEAQLAVAQRGAESRGALESALAELGLRKNRVEKLQELRTKGFAREQEVERSRTDLAIAEAQVLSARDLIAVKQLEHAKIKAQVERRTVRAPIDGVVSAIDKHPGEHVSPSDAQVLTLVQIDTLRAVFSLTTGQAMRLEKGQEVQIQLSLMSNEIGGAESSTADNTEAITGVVEYIAPVTHAESGTVVVKVTLVDPNGRCRSGERCWLQLSGDLPQIDNALSMRP